MKLTAPFIWLVVAVGVAEASFPHSERDLSAHARHARNRRDIPDVSNNQRRGSLSKRCKPRTSSSAAPSQSPAAKPVQAAEKKPDVASSAPAPKKTESSQSGGGTPSGASGLMKVTSSECGASGATDKITATTGPNGAEDWFNCGISGGGWNPPLVTVNDVIVKDLSAAYSEPNSPFKGCSQWIGMFNQYGAKHGVPPIFIASIAMQESSCNENEVGGAGEQGIMQITKDKCGGAPGGNCKDPNYNIDTGAGFLKSLIDQNGGNVLKAIGEYNGWKPGLTVGAATAAAHTSCCTCQNNLDYLTQFMNGWVLGIDPTSSNPRIGKYFNLDVCDR